MKFFRDNSRNEVLDMQGRGYSAMVHYDEYLMTQQIEQDHFPLVSIQTFLCSHAGRKKQSSVKQFTGKYGENFSIFNTLPDKTIQIHELLRILLDYKKGESLLKLQMGWCHSK